MLRLDSSEMLPGSQKGEETAQILKTQTRFRPFASPYALYYGISMVGTGNDHVTAARCNRRAVTSRGCYQYTTHFLILPLPKNETKIKILIPRELLNILKNGNHHILRHGVFFLLTTRN